ncbi:putative endopeptidase [Rhizomicrobium palustre]|uniref:Putative endopeptidase n=1 Tax=Rhizomicrobium palustre TaxID=189966 RepID=A0A846MV39_9PROT|nr:M13 family metallopeptidase [Rhizomicrobium palustre]NIK87051.1 putative endopeptidase [Rhizomicrobium palustre]
MLRKALTGVALGAVLMAVSAAGSAEDLKLKYGSWGFDAAGVDPATKPGDSFFRYANGSWLDKTAIPADKAMYTLRIAMTDLTEQRQRALLEEAAAHAGHAPSDLEGKLGAFYKSFMAEAAVEKAGAAPLKPLLDEVRAAKSRDDLAALMGRNNADFEGSLFGVNIDADLKDPSRYALYVGQAGLWLPDRDYYLQAGFAKQKAQYEAFVLKLLTLLNWPDAETEAKAVVALETRIAEASWTKVQQRDLNAVYNPMSPAELKAFAPGFAWDRFFAEVGVKDISRVVVAEKSAFPKLAAIYGETPLSTLRAWAAFNIAANASPYLSKPFADAFFEMHDKTLSGQEVETVRWKRGVHAVSGGDYGAGDRFDYFGSMGWGVGQMYAAKYFPASAKEKIEDLVTHVKAAYRTRLQNLDWMSPATKVEALKKLDTYTIKVGYPDTPRDYSALIIRDDDLIGNVRRTAAHAWAFYVKRLNGPVDRSDWLMTPQTNDAYNGSLRDIVFPAGILQPPIFDAEADPAINYGAAGAIIGHELTHGFDDEGRKIDAAGALRDWWTAEDDAKFVARAKKLAAQYSAFEPLPDVHINGDLTLGENIADLGGLTLALAAYRASLGGKPAPVIDGLTGDQRVFLGWAQAWRGKLRDDAIKRQVASDPHSPRRFRVDGVVRNLDDWYQAFGVKPGEKLYVPPEDRVRIW